MSTRRCPRRNAAHELGPAAQTGLRHRHRTLPELRRQLEDHRRPFDTHRRSTGDRQDPQASGPTDPRPAACAGASSRSIPNDLRNRLPMQADGTARSEFDERRDLQPRAHLRSPRRPRPCHPRPQQGRNSSTQLRLTGSARWRYISAQKKVV